jgi:hypothetical protein
MPESNSWIFGRNSNWGRQSMTFTLYFRGRLIAVVSPAKLAPTITMRRGGPFFEILSFLSRVDMALDCYVTI